MQFGQPIPNLMPCINSRTRESCCHLLLCFPAGKPSRLQGFAAPQPEPEESGRAYLVCSIMPRPKEVVLEEISRQGKVPIVAPVKPYTLLALSCTQHRPH